MSEEAFDRNRIAQSLSLEELEAFLAELAALPGKDRTLAAIQAKAAERGIVISLMSAKSFRDTTFGRHLARVQRRKEKAQSLTSLMADGTGRTLNDANAAILAEKIFDELNADDDATDDDAEASRLDLEKAGELSKMIARLRKGDVAREALEAALKVSEARLREMEAKEREREEKKAKLKEQLSAAANKKGGITKETMAEIEQSLALL